MYTYYRFLDRFHVVPESWSELFEFTDFSNLDSEIKELINKYNGDE